jgi:uncharacterized caspase-like protein
LRQLDSYPDGGRTSRSCDGVQRSRYWSLALLLATALVISLIVAVAALAQTRFSPIQPKHLQEIRELFRANGLTQATVELDSRGRVELQGDYENEQQVRRAFSIAQYVVGPLLVSPVTPERIRVKAWMSCLERLMAGLQCDTPDSRTSTQAAQPESPPGPLRERYALVVGVGRFQNKDIDPLQYPAKDAQDVYDYLVDPSGGNFRPEVVVLLQDQRATRAEVLKAMEKIKAQADPDDLVLVYFSSHGTPPNEFGGVHMTTYDTVLKPREQVWESSVSDDKLRSFIEGVRAKRLVIILDVCYSNGAFADVPGFVAPGSKSLMANENEGYGWSQRAMAERLLGMKDPGQERSSGAKSLSAAPHQWGTILISASDAGEQSWESDTLRSGVFTHYFLDGLVRTRGSLKEAFEHAHPRVLEYVKSEKRSVQTPQLTSKPSPSDISVAQKR